MNSSESSADLDDDQKLVEDLFDWPKLKVQLKKLPKDVLIEKIFPDFAWAHVNYRRCDEERKMLRKLADHVRIYECMVTGCRAFCGLEDNWWAFNFEEHLVYDPSGIRVMILPKWQKFQQAVENANSFGVYCSDCERYTCPKHWREQMGVSGNIMNDVNDVNVQDEIESHAEDPGKSMFTCLFCKATLDSIDLDD